MAMLPTILINYKSTKKNNKRGRLRTKIKGEETEKKYFFSFFYPFLDKKFLRALESSFCLSFRASIVIVRKAIPYGIRTRVLAMKRRCPIPLDERDKITSNKNVRPELRCDKKNCGLWLVYAPLFSFIYDNS
jgi:hypothetical protein